MQVIQLKQGKRGLEEQATTSGFKDGTEFACECYGNAENIDWKEIDNWFFTVTEGDYVEIELSEVKSTGFVTMIAARGGITPRWYPMKVKVHYTDKGIFITQQDWWNAHA